MSEGTQFHAWHFNRMYQVTIKLFNNKKQPLKEPNGINHKKQPFYFFICTNTSKYRKKKSFVSGASIGLSKKTIEVTFKEKN